MSRLLSFRSFLLETADDIVDAYRIAQPSSPIPSSSSSMILPPTPGKYDQLPVLSIPQSVIDAWPVFSSHLPVMFKEGRDWQLFYCSVPRCQGRIRHYCKTCKMALCFFRPKSNSQNCWLLHHERLFTGRGRELYRDYLSKARNTYKRSYDDISDVSSIVQESDLADDQTDSDLDWQAQRLKSSIEKVSSLAR